MTTTVGFLQNQWFKSPEKAKKVLVRCASRGEGREAFIRRTLFRGCLAGRRLVEAFGEEACQQIIWEEVSPLFGRGRDALFAPDPEHIRGVITQHKPNLVICFGGVALRGFREAVYRRDLPWGILLCATDPASRDRLTVKDLAITAQQYRDHLEMYQMAATQGPNNG